MFSMGSLPDGCVRSKGLSTWCGSLKRPWECSSFTCWFFPQWQSDGHKKKREIQSPAGCSTVHLPPPTCHLPPSLSSLTLTGCLLGASNLPPTSFTPTPHRHSLLPLFIPPLSLLLVLLHATPCCFKFSKGLGSDASTLTGAWVEVTVWCHRRAWSPLGKCQGAESEGGFTGGPSVNIMDD